MRIGVFMSNIVPQIMHTLQNTRIFKPALTAANSSSAPLSLTSLSDCFLNDIWKRKGNVV
jgi:hypothetical protein